MNESWSRQEASCFCQTLMKGQAYGKRAKQAASALVFGKQVTLKTFGKDKYGRTIADVLLPDGSNVNHALVGMAGAGGIGSMRQVRRNLKS
jgi:endonuclease YncB( thermonuclease family)